jgi:integration host factor subunit alpha
MPHNHKNKPSSNHTLTRDDLARAVYDRFDDLSFATARRLVDSILEEMLASLASGKTMKLHKFGAFVVRNKNERIGRNLRTGEAALVKPKKVVVFKASPNLKAAVNGALRRRLVSNIAEVGPEKAAD